MKKHLLAVFAVLACVFSLSAFSATPLEQRSVVGVTRWGNDIVFGPGYQSPVPNKTTWNSLPGTPHIGNVTDVKPKSVTVSVNSAAKSVAINAVIQVPAAKLFAELNITNTVTQAALTGAVTGLVTGGPGNAIFMGTTSALMAWALTADGVSSNPSFPDGQTTHPFMKNKEDPTVCFFPTNKTDACEGYGSSACSLAASVMGGTVRNYDEENQYCYVNYGGDYFGVGIGKRIILGDLTKVPATWADIAPSVQASSPPGNILPEALTDALDRGAHPDMQTSVTGPATGEGATETTTSETKNPDGSPAVTTKTTTNVNNYTYNNNKLTWNNTVKTETTNPDGSKDTDTTVKDPGKDEKPEEPETPPTDTPLGPVPDLYERKYPDGMEGVWNTYKDQLKNTSLGSLASKLMPNIPDGGTCPQWPINLDMAQWAAFGTHDVAPPCYIWGIAKAILVVSALLLARALIFGG